VHHPPRPVGEVHVHLAGIELGELPGHALEAHEQVGRQRGPHAASSDCRRARTAPLTHGRPGRQGAGLLAAIALALATSGGPLRPLRPTGLLADWIHDWDGNEEPWYHFLESAVLASAAVNCLRID